MSLKEIENSNWKIARLTDETEIGIFDCGDDDLNNFLTEDAKNYLNL